MGEGKESDNDDDDVESPEVEKFIILRSLMVDRVLKDTVNVELEVHADAAVVVIVIDDPMNVLLLESFVLDLEVVDYDLEEMCLKQKQLDGRGVGEVKGLSDALSRIDDIRCLVLIFLDFDVILHLDRDVG